jgi:Tol biopolymer transport system component
MIGRTIGSYHVLAKLGEGGMGEVYRASDTTLNRDVALKLLPDAFTKDPDRLARFKREAQVLASLNHPNIAAIYGFEDANHALVMELVEGPTLAERITNGPIPLDEVLPIARQIAEALEAAHEKGIIHRDLKPANVAFTADGHVKVLDFGLAKALDPVAGSDLTNSPTLTLAATQAGVILGTAAYMAPEQAKGRAADKRSDVWAFGCVLYEMLTGTRPFEGDDISEILACVLKSDPVWSALPVETPPAIRRLLHRCLQKDRRQRLADVADARLEIDDALGAPATDALPPAPRHASIGSIALAVSVAAVTAAVATWALTRRSPQVPPSVTRLSIAPAVADALTVSGNDRDVAISPDGRRVAYVGGNGTSLVIRDLDRSDPIRIDGIGLPHNPFFSPDGAWVGFVDGLSALRKLPVRGGAVETICRFAFPGVGATWAGDTIVFNMYGGLWRVSAAGGEPEKLTPVAADGQPVYFNPSFLPGGRAVLFAFAGKEQGIGVLDLQRGTTKVVMRAGMNFNGAGATYLDSGHLIYASRAQAQGPAALNLIGFDVNRLETVGTPVALNEPIFITPFGRVPDFDVSQNGTLVYVAATAEPAARRLVWVARDGHEEPIDAPVRAYTYPNVAPDGRQVAIDIRDQENDTWIWDLGRRTLRRLTFDPGFNQYAVWTRDGRRVLYLLNQNLVWQQADGSGVPEVVARRTHLLAPYAFSPDGRRLVFREDFPETGHDLMVLSLEGERKVEPLLQARFNELNAEISPDGRWVAYESDESGAHEIYVRPFPDVKAGRWQISTAGGRMPLWARDGRELFFLASGGALMSAAIDAGQTFVAGAPARLFDHHYYIGGASSIGRTYDVAPDGRGFLMIKPDTGQPASLMVVLDWFEELKARVPAK